MCVIFMDKKKINSLVIVCMLIVGFFTVFTVLETETVAGANYYVGGGGANNYTAIQDAIDDASSGDTIYVFSGTYDENIFIDKSLSLIGEDRASTFINGGGEDDVIRINSDRVNITEFNISNSGSGWGNSGIYINGDHCDISHNIITNNYMGVYGNWDEDNIVLSDNMIISNYNGITVYGCNDWYVGNNTISNSANYGIYSYRSQGWTVTDNNISSNNNYGLNLQYYSRDWIISYNEISDNNYGIYVRDYCDNITVESSYIRSNSWDVYVYRGSDVTFYNSTLEGSNHVRTNTESTCRLVNSSFDQGLVDTDSGSRVIVDWYSNIIVEDSSDQPVSDAMVTIKNVDGNVTGLSTTGINGWSRLNQVTEYIQMGGITYKTPHNITAFKGLLAGLNITNINQTMDIKVTLNITAPEVDYILVEDEPGSGSIHGKRYLMYDNYTLYASGYNNTYGFLHLVSADWTSNDTLVADVGPGPAMETNMDTGQRGYCRISITNGTLSNFTDLVIFAPVHNLDQDIYYKNIQPAVDESNDYDTIYVSNWTFTEHLYIDNPLNLVGESRANTIIEGGDNYNIIDINSNHVNISGFTIRDSGLYRSGIYLRYDREHITIYDNIIADNWYGIMSSNHNNYIKIHGNMIIDNNYDGIEVNEQCVGWQIYNNNISGNNNNGIEVRSRSNDWRIYDNIISHNSYGLNLRNSANHTIENCTITGNNYGIYGYEGSEFTGYNLTIDSVNDDIRIEGDTRGIIVNSSFDDGKLDITDGSELRVGWFLHVKVEDELGNGIGGVYTKVTNNNDEKLRVGSTNAHGWMNWTVGYEYIQNTTGKDFLIPLNITAYSATMAGYRDVYLNMSMNTTVILNKTKPAVDYILIEEEIEGGGIDGNSYGYLSNFTLYSSGYNNTLGYLHPVETAWSSDNPSVASVDPGPSDMTNMQTLSMGTCNIQIVNGTHTDTASITVYAQVENVDKGLYYKEIQPAIDEADPGDTIKAYRWTFNENLYIGKTLNLVGENRTDCIIQGVTDSDVVRVSADWVNVSGFTIKGSGQYDGGIYIFYSNNNISIFDNILTENDYGIRCYNYVQDVQIFDNKIMSNHRDGIYVNGDHSINWKVYNNNIFDNNWRGIRMYYVSGWDVYQNNIYSNNYQNIYGYRTDDLNLFNNDILLSDNSQGIYADGSNNWSVSSNNISSNDYQGIYGYYCDDWHVENNVVMDSGWSQGIYMDHSDRWEIIDNTIIENYRDGIEAQNSNNGHVFSNNISSNRNHGLDLYNSDSWFINRNEISSNDLRGIRLSGSSMNEISLNEFYFNDGSGASYNPGDVQAEDDTLNNTWNNSYLGNYWHDWAMNNDTNDMNGDGIVDWPYVLDVANDMDHYPLKYSRGVLTTIPHHNESGVSVSQKVSVIFKESMDTAVTPTLTQTDGADPSGWIFDGWSDTNAASDTATWSHVSWNVGETVVMEVKDYQYTDGTVGESHAWNFTVEAADNDNPVVKSHRPVGGNVPLSENIVVGFNESIDNSTLSLSINGGSDSWTKADGQVSWDPSLKVLTFDLDTDYSTNTYYEVTVDCSDINGNGLDGGPFTWNFTTVSAPPESEADPSNTLPSLITQQEFEVDYTATDDEDLNSITLYYRYDDGSWTTGPKQDISGTSEEGSFGFNITQYEGDGKYDFYTLAEDIDGNIEDKTAVVEASTIVDSTLPYVVDTTPSDEEIDVELDINITIEFSEEMDTGSVEDAIQIDPAITPSYSWNDENTILTISSSEDLTYGTVYNITIGADSADINGNTLGSDHVFSFTTVSDPKPSLEITSPKRYDEYDIGETIFINWTASDNNELPENPITIEVSYDGGSTWTDIESTYGNTGTYQWSTDVTSDEVQIRITCIDNAGQSTSRILGEFEVRDQTSPEIIDTDPEDGAEDVPVDNEIVIEFSESVDPSTVTVIWSDGEVEFELAYSNGNKTLTVDPVEDLAHNTNYTLTIRAMDLSGNQVEKVISFTTEAEEDSGGQGTEPEEDASIMDYWWIFLVVIAVVVLLVVVMKKKGGSKPVQTGYQEQPPPPEQTGVEEAPQEEPWEKEPFEEESTVREEDTWNENSEEL